MYNVNEIYRHAQWTFIAGKVVFSLLQNDAMFPEVRLLEKGYHKVKLIKFVYNVNEIFRHRQGTSIAGKIGFPLLQNNAIVVKIICY